MQAKDAELEQQLQAAGALETDLITQLNVSLLLLFASQSPMIENHPSGATPCSSHATHELNASAPLTSSGVCCPCMHISRVRPVCQDTPLWLPLGSDSSIHCRRLTNTASIHASMPLEAHLRVSAQFHSNMCW